MMLRLICIYVKGMFCSSSWEAHLINNPLSKLYVSCGFRVYKGTRLVAEPNAYTLSHDDLPSRLHHLDVKQFTEDVVDSV